MVFQIKYLDNAITKEKITLIMDLNHYKHPWKRLGHSNIEITWRVYSHLLEELKDKEDESLDFKLTSF